MGLSVTNPIRAIMDEQAQVQADVQADKLSYRDAVLDLSQPIDEPKFLFSIGGVPTIPAGELIGIKGRAKVGKSQLEYYLIAAMLAGASRGSVKPLQDRCKVILADTEQSKASLKKCCQRALFFAGLPINENTPYFLPMFMRSLSIEERRQKIADAIEAEHPDIVFVDGIRDLLKDFNNLDESNDLIQWLLSLTAEHGCTIVSVLHQNKAKDDGNMRGHLGSELLNKLTDCIEVSKKDGKFIICCTDSRNVPFPDFAFSINAEGHFQVEDVTQPDKGAARAADIQRVLRLCLKDTDAMSYGDLVRRYALEAAVSEPTAKRHIKEAKDHEFIFVSNGLYSLIPNGG